MVVTVDEDAADADAPKASMSVPDSVCVRGCGGVGKAFISALTGYIRTMSYV